MSFSTQHPTCRVVSAMGGGWELWESNPEATDSGWDTATALFAKDFKGSSVTGTAVANEWQIGQSLGGNWWCSGIKPRLLNGNIWTCQLSAKGLLATRPVKVRGRSTAEQQSATKINVPGYGLANKLQTLESAPTLEIEYISFAQPPTHKVGLAGFPGVTVATRGSVWASLADPTYHFPNGWVFVDIDWDKITGANVWLVREIWAKIFPFSP